MDQSRIDSVSTAFTTTTMTQHNNNNTATVTTVETRYLPAKDEEQSFLTAVP